MKLFFLALVALFVGACTPSMRTQTPHNDASAALERKTVALVAIRGFEARAYCSGVWVGQDAILTAYHCVDDVEPGDRVTYVTRADLSASDADELETVHLADLVAHDDEHDLALLQTKLTPAHDVAHVARRAPYVGEPVQTMGHPLGLWWSYSTGVIAAVRYDADEGQWLVQSTAAISPGNSGGALFDNSGDVLGVCHEYAPRGENVNLYVHGDYAWAFLRAQGLEP